MIADKETERYILLMTVVFVLSLWSVLPAKATDVSIDIYSSEMRKVGLALPYFSFPLNQPDLLHLRNEALKILTFDLRESGLFQLIDIAAYSDEVNNDYQNKKTIPFSAWYLEGVQAVAVGEIKKSGDELEISGALFDVKMEMMMTGKKYKGKAYLFRQMVHKFADEIVFRFTGENGIAHSRIVFVQEKAKSKELIVMDYDGFNKLDLTMNSSINLSPEWDRQARLIYFTSYFESTPAIYSLDIESQKTRKVSAFSGLNGSPAISPDGTKLALTLSKDGNSEIYTMTVAGKNLTRLTFDKGIDTSPSWSPSGREIVYTSDRAGSPQLYIMDAEGLNLRRLTFSGSYNDSADWSPQGNLIAYASREQGVFNIYTISVDGSQLRQLTSQQRSNENPGWSPDGNFIVFSSTRDGQANIFIMDKFGHNLRRLTYQSGNCISPDWSP